MITTTTTTITTTTHMPMRCFVFDQTYALEGRAAGAGSKYTNAVERVDAAGNAMARTREKRHIYINSFDVTIYHRECALSQAAIDTIAQRGPYTQVPYHSLS